MGFGDADEDDGSRGAQIGSKEWLKARKRAIIKKSTEEGFQDRAIRFLGSVIVVVVMLVMLYGSIGLLSGEGVEQLPCETTRKLMRFCFFLEIARLSAVPGCLD